MYFVNTFNGDKMKKFKKPFLFICANLVLITLLYFFMYLLPPPIMLKSHQIEIYDQNNNLILTTHYDLIGKYLTLDEINEDFIACFIASEDEDFNNHIGFSFKGIFRAFFSNMGNSSTQGGSTITQQLSRSLFLDNQKSLKRKIKEALITIRLETHYQKKEIIEQYLNNIYLGHNLYGIEQASQYYFNKSNKELNIDEVALIVGIANAPNLNAPDINYQNSLNRKKYVLNRLYKTGYINQKTYQLYENYPTLIHIQKQQLDSIINPFYYYILHQLKELELDSKGLYAKGLKIYTTIDLNMQQILYDTIQSYSPNDTSEVSGLIMKANSGDVLAMLGGTSIFDEYNRALYSKRPIDSTIKPLLYYLALLCGMNPLTTFDCRQTTFNIEGFEAYRPSNATNQYATKKINMIEAIALSDNIYATKTLLYVGFENFEKLLNLFHIKTKCVPSSALGVDEMSLIEILSIYNTFASLGDFYKPRIIKKITSSNDQVYYLNSPKKRHVLEKSYVYILNQLLRAPFDENLIDYTSPTLLNYQTNSYFGAKTGSDPLNAYTIGFNPLYSIGIWSGAESDEQFTYKNLSKKIFQQVANSINTQNVWYNPPSYILKKKINPKDGNNQQNGSVYWFLN